MKTKQLRTRLSAFFMSLILLVSMVPDTLLFVNAEGDAADVETAQEVAEGDEAYNLWIGTHRVTHNDINGSNEGLSSGSYTYDPETKTLNFALGSVLEYTAPSDQIGGIVCGLYCGGDLTITGNVSVYQGIYVNGKLTLAGNISAGNFCLYGIYADKGVHIEYGPIHAGGQVAIETGSGTIDVQEYAGASGRFTDYDGTANYYNAGQTIHKSESDSTVVRDVYFSNTYNIWVGNKQVNDYIKDQITYDGMNSTSYDPIENVLKFNGSVTIDGYHTFETSKKANIFIMVPNIKITGKADLSGAGYGIYFAGSTATTCVLDNADLTITAGSAGIMNNDLTPTDLTLTGNTKLDITLNSGGYGIATKNINFDDCTVNIHTVHSGAVMAKNVIVINDDNVYIETPENGYVYKNNSNEYMIGSGEKGSEEKALDLSIKQYKKATVSFNMSGKEGEAPISQNVVIGKTATKPVPDPETDGFDFTGWFTDEDCKNAYDFSTAVTEDFTLYAGWKEKAAKSEEETEEDDKKDTVALKGIKVSENVIIKTGEKLSISVNFTPADATDKSVTFESDNKEVAAVDAAGVVTGVKAGFANIKVTAKDGGFSAICKVEVTAASAEDNEQKTVITPGDEESVKTPKVEPVSSNISVGKIGAEKLAVEVAISANYLNAVPFTGKAITPKTCPEAFAFDIDLSDVVAKAGITGVDWKKLIKVNFSGKSKKIGDAEFIVKLSVIPKKSRKEITLTKQQEKDLKNLVKAINSFYKKTTFKFFINKASITSFAAVEVHALDKKGELNVKADGSIKGLKSVKYKATEKDKLKKLAKNAYTATAADAAKKTVKIQGKGNYTGWITVEAVK